MYNLPYYKAKDHEQVLEFMRQHPFVAVTTVDNDGFPVATHIPVLLEERAAGLFLVGHIMKQSDHHKALLCNNKVLVIFSGPHTYISASWYQHKQQASTWNYQAVHVKGLLTFLGEEALLDILTRTTAHFENDPSSPALVDRLPVDYTSKLMKAIVGFEIAVKDVAHVFKLSQNKDEETYSAIVSKLKTGDAEARQVASIMEKTCPYEKA